ncbi:MAG: hypothetical protein IH851_02585 [Armatimonadetes bacterium]|nr:hypothetical protein [Armatimonadota bacterium]
MSKHSGCADSTVPRRRAVPNALCASLAVAAILNWHCDTGPRLNGDPAASKAQSVGARRAGSQERSSEGEPYSGGIYQVWFRIGLDTDLGDLRWSPSGDRLAYSQEGDLCLWPDGAQITLIQDDFSSVALDLEWSPDGEFIVARGNGKTLLVDATEVEVVETFDDHRFIWWMDGRRCWAEPLDAGARTPDDVQTWHFGSRRRELPPGLTLIAYAAGGGALLAEHNPADGGGYPEGPLVLLRMDIKTGKILWRKTIHETGRMDYRSTPILAWNEGLHAAAILTDASGGGTFVGRVYSGDAVHELESVYTAGDSYNWVMEPVSWVGDELCVSLSLAYSYKPSENVQATMFWREINFFSVKDGTMRSVYQSDYLGFKAVASAEWLAFVEIRDGDRYLVIAPWARGSDGRLLRPIYDPDPWVP